MSSAVPAETPREQETITGTLNGIVQKGPDKWQAVVLPENSQYNKNLWTKDVDVVRYLTSQIGNRIGILCNASHWTRDDGQPVRSLWIEQVGAPSVAAPQQPQAQAPPGAFPLPGQTYTPPPQAGPPVVVQPQVTPMAQAPQGDLREQKIHRQTASKVAAIMLTYVKPEEQNMTTLLVLAERLVGYYNTGLPNAETLDDLMQRAMPRTVDQGPPAAEYTHEPPPLPQDDDIPF